MVYDGNNSLKGNKAFFDRFYDELMPNPKFQRAVYDYLMEQDVESVDEPATLMKRTKKSNDFFTQRSQVHVHFITQGYDQFGTDDRPLKGELQLFDAFCGRRTTAKTESKWFRFSAP